MCIPKKTYLSVRVVHMAEVFGIQYRNARNRRIDIIGGCNWLTNVPVALCSPYHERLSSLYPQDIQYGLYTKTSDDHFKHNTDHFGPPKALSKYNRSIAQVLNKINYYSIDIRFRHKGEVVIAIIFI